MKEKIKKILVVLSTVIIIGVLGYIGYRYYEKEALEGGETERIKSQEEMAIKELVEKYDTLTDWNKNIHYTIQLQDLLVNSDKPVLFTGPVDDIFIKDDQYYIRFITGGLWSWEFSGSQVYFVLKCDASKVSEIMKEIESKKTENDLSIIYPWGFGEYVVVAKIENVTKPILQISGYSGYESEEVELEYEPSSTFIATGICIDFVYIDEDANSIFNE